MFTKKQSNNNSSPKAPGGQSILAGGSIAQAVLLAIRPLAHVLLALLEQVHANAVRQVCGVRAEVAVAVVERIDAMAIALRVAVLPDIVAAVHALLHAGAIADAVSPGALVVVAVEVAADAVAAPAARHVLACMVGCGACGGR